MGGWLAEWDPSRYPGRLTGLGGALVATMRLKLRRAGMPVHRGSDDDGGPSPQIWALESTSSGNPPESRVAEVGLTLI